MNLNQDNSLWRAFILPFVRQRNYWRKADGRTAERANHDLASNENHLAE